MSSRIPDGAGIGLRLPHLLEVVATRPDVGWLEIHPENFLANAHAMELLTELSRTYPIAVHTVGISVGSAGGIDRLHVKRIRKLVDRIDPFFVSGHLAWSTFGLEYLNDLLPLPLNAETLSVVARNIIEVQDALGRRYLVENPSSYIDFSSSTMAEAEFLSELVLRTGCRLLCDVSNVYVSARNMAYDPYLYIDSLSADAIAEMHLGGYTPEGDLLVDTHAAPIAEPAWDLYAYAVRRFGLKPTLIEWDNEIPPLVTLVNEGTRAEAIVSDALQPEGCRAGAS
jgi:uncharacterized protein (UPF0276 family)